MRVFFWGLAAMSLSSGCIESRSGEALLDRADATVLAFSETLEGSATPSTTLAQETGTAQLKGVAVVAALTGIDEASFNRPLHAAVGDFTATADFGAAQSVNATADNFHEVEGYGEDGLLGLFELEDRAGLKGLTLGERLEGSFDYDLAINLKNADAFVEGTIDGSVIWSDGSRLTMTAADADGLFYGPNADAMEVFGDARDDADGTISLINAVGIRQTD